MLGKDPVSQHLSPVLRLVYRWALKSREVDGISTLKGPLADDLESLGLGKFPASLEALLTVGVSINSLAASWCELGLWPLCGMGWRKALLAERGAHYFAYQNSTTEYAFSLWLAVRHLSFYDSREVHFLIPPAPRQILLLGSLTRGCLWDLVMPMNFWEVQNQVEGTFSSTSPHLEGISRMCCYQSSLLDRATTSCFSTIALAFWNQLLSSVSRSSPSHGCDGVLLLWRTKPRPIATWSGKGFVFFSACSL